LEGFSINRRTAVALQHSHFSHCASAFSSHEVLIECEEILRFCSLLRPKDLVPQALAITAILDAAAPAGDGAVSAAIAASATSARTPTPDRHDKLRHPKSICHATPQVRF
jgi:hypothetical protein